MPADDGMNKYNAIALIFGAVQIFMHSPTMKSTPKPLLVLDFYLLCSGIEVELVPSHSFSKLFLTNLTPFGRISVRNRARYGFKHFICLHSLIP